MTQSFTGFSDFKSRYPIRPNDPAMLLGSGSYGRVIKVEDQLETEWVAVKISEFKGVEDRSLREEVNLAQRIPRQANIARYDACFRFATDTGLCDFALMKYYPDGNLAELLRHHQLTAIGLYDLTKGILCGLRHLHGQRIVHRDFKPANILISRDNQGRLIPKIADFGLSKLVEHDEIDNSEFDLGDGRGTLSYKAPEQIDGSRVGFNLDLWAFGVILYELLTGEKPFAPQPGQATEQAIRRSIELSIMAARLPARLAELPQPYQAIIRRCLVRDPQQRARKVDELLDLLDTIPPPIAGSQLIAYQLYDEPTDLFLPRRETAGNVPSVDAPAGLAHRYVADLARSVNSPGRPSVAADQRTDLFLTPDSDPLPGVTVLSASAVAGRFTPATPISLTASQNGAEQVADDVPADDAPNFWPGLPTRPKAKRWPYAGVVAAIMAGAGLYTGFLGGTTAPKRADLVGTLQTKQVGLASTTAGIDRDMVVNLPFTGGSWRDYSGSGNHARPVGKPLFTTDRRGTPNAAVLLDGKDDYFYLTDNPSLRPDSLSVSLWINVRALNGRMTLYNKSRFSDSYGEQYSALIKPAYRGKGVTINTDLKQGSPCGFNGGWQTFPVTSSLPILNTWRHIVFTYENRTARMYLDGVLLSERTDLPRNRMDSCAGGDLKFGALIKAYPQYFNGAIDDVRVYRRALTPNEVTALKAL